MKKSDRNLLQERLQKLSQPPPTREEKPDATDEINDRFGGGSLPSAPLATAVDATVDTAADTTSLSRLPRTNPNSPSADARAFNQQPDPDKRGRGRPAGSAGGKRDNDKYTQAGAYLRKETHRSVKAALALEDKEFSELVEELLVEWLKSRQ